MRDLDLRMQEKCDKDWAPRKMGWLVPRDSGAEYSRTTILPALFDGQNGVQLVHWRQQLTLTGHQAILAGTLPGAIIPEDFKIAWVGLAFPNKQQQISEIRFQIGDRKYGRINLEEMHTYKVPALIFEEGFLIDEEQSYDLWGYVEGADFQRVVMLGACYAKYVDKLLGNPGAAI